MNLPPSFGQTPLDLHRYYGVHRSRTADGFLYTFRFFSEEALQVFLIGEFLSWDHGKAMHRLDHGVWELTLFSVISLEGSLYKYKVYRAGRTDYLSDPFAADEEATGGRASRIACECSVSHRKPPVFSSAKHPIHLLEASLTSLFTRHNRPPTEPGVILSYKELAEGLCIYLKSTGYTHVKLMATRQTASLFAPSPFHGSASEFAEFIDCLHGNGVGVILTFAYPNTKEEADLILSASDRFLSLYQLDGISFDAEGDYSPKAAASLTVRAAELKKRHSCLLFADDIDIGSPRAKAIDYWRSEAFENLLTDFLASDFADRPRKLVGVIQALLDEAPLSASQSKYLTRGGELSLMQSFRGGYEQKFAENRLYQMLLAAKSSAKLSFMLASLAPFRPWRDDLQPEWYMADFKLHRAHRRFVRAFNRLLLTDPLFAKQSLSPNRMKTKVVHFDKDRAVFALEIGLENDRRLFVYNTSDTLYTDYALPVSGNAYTEVFSSDEESYAGFGYVNRITLTAVDGRLTLDLAPLSAVLLQPDDCTIEI